ncbi:MAG TPA: histidine kinase dimerization/phosphoacceptor domain -containing protein [Treponemataceae bacterium]|nr:histidine kinase dimerization/phosphoacceptor domain -containing protein [Treponemataceae bacterium]
MNGRAITQLSLLSFVGVFLVAPLTAEVQVSSPGSLACAFSPRFWFALGFAAIVLLALFHAFIGARKSRRSNQAAFAESDRLNRAFLRAFPDSIFIVSRDGSFVKYSAGNLPIAGLPPDGVAGKNITDLLSPDDAARLTAALESVLNTGETREIEMPLESPFGEKTFEFRIVPLDSGHALSIARDVTDRIAQEASMVAHLKEKEALIREVHHRVKNNLQVMSSLIALQSDLLRDETDKLLMQETQRRIHTMAYLHNLIYRSEDCASIDLGEYIDEIVRNLQIALSVTPEQIGVNLDVTSVRVLPETALPVGLIVNELVSNSFEYAFPGLATGSISVQAILEGPTLTLTVSDTGCGLPAGFSPEKAQSLGWILINSLSRQIGAKLELLPGAGTAVRLTFPLSEK